MKRLLDEINRDPFDYEYSNYIDQFHRFIEGGIIFFSGKMKSNEIDALIDCLSNKKGYFSEKDISLELNQIIIEESEWVKLSKCILGYDSIFHDIKIYSSQLLTKENIIMPLFNFKEYTLAAELLKSTYCKKFLLSENNISFQGLILLTTALYNNPCIKEISIYNNFDYNPDLNRIPVIQSTIYKLGRNSKIDTAHYLETANGTQKWECYYNRKKDGDNSFDTKVFFNP